MAERVLRRRSVVPAVRAAMEANREERTISRCEFRSIVIAERRRWSHRASCARKIYE